MQPAARQSASSLSRYALKARDALVMEHLPLAVAERFRGAVAIASAMARRLFPLVDREDLDLIQVAREALVRSAPRCRSGEPAKGVDAGQAVAHPRLRSVRAAAWWH